MTCSSLCMYIAHVCIKLESSHVHEASYSKRFTQREAT